MKRKVARRPLALILAIFMPSLMILVLTNSGIPIAKADVETEHGHGTEVTNKNNEHEVVGQNENESGKDGSHFNSNCVENSNNNKGQVCHTNERDR